MTTHLGSTTVEELRVPKVPKDSRPFREIVSLNDRLSKRPSRRDMALLKATAAEAYKLTSDDFRHVLGTFPLVAESERADALGEFSGRSFGG
ncbi:MAG: hypothetical protein EXQ55_06630 [Acidobacteria bacterium]|nr:hypothetical protein [Acidobacteriota bacterium]